MGGRRQQAKKKKPKAKPQHKENEAVLPQVPIAQVSTTDPKPYFPTTETIIHTLIILGTIGGIMAGVLASYQQHTPLVWTTCLTISIFFLAACLKWQGRARWAYWVVAILVTIGTCLIWQTRIWNQEALRITEEQARAKQPQLQQPTFRDSGEKIQITFGNNAFIFSRSNLESGITLPADFGGNLPLRLYSEDNKIYADVTVSGGRDTPVIVLEKNVFTVRPPNWDFNSSDKAFEVINQQRIPVFQLIFKTPSRIEINGVFPVEKGILFASNKGILLNNPVFEFPPMIREDKAGYDVNRIFKYPSWQHPGEYENAP